jgi:hypothetical protein
VPFVQSQLVLQASDVSCENLGRRQDWHRCPVLRTRWVRVFGGRVLVGAPSRFTLISTSGMVGGSCSAVGLVLRRGECEKVTLLVS